MERYVQYVDGVGWWLRYPPSHMNLKMKRKLFHVHDADFRTLAKIIPLAFEVSPNNRLPHKIRGRGYSRRKAPHMGQLHDIALEKVSNLNPLASEFVPSFENKLLPTPPSPLRTEHLQIEKNERTTSIGFISNLSESELKNRINEEFDNFDFSRSSLNDLFASLTFNNSWINVKFRCDENVASASRFYKYFQVI